MNVSRVFLSSTFSDFVWERETLNLEIVPEINAALAAKGRRIDLLDLRWGVSREAGLDNFAVDICLNEIRRSAVSGARPFFMYLGSTRAGWKPCPRVSDNGGECLVLRPGRERQRLDLQAFLELVWDTLGAEGPISDERASAGKGPSAEGLREYLAQPRDRVLTLFVDGIDECDWRDSAEAVSWIPLSAGEGLTLIVSTSAPALRSSFEDVFGAENLLDLPELSASETRSAIDLNLRSAGRQLQDGQWASILEGLDQMDGKAVATRLAATIGRTVPAEAELPRFLLI